MLLVPILENVLGIFKEINHFLETGEKLEPPTLDEKFEMIKRHLRKNVPQWECR